MRDKRITIQLRGGQIINVWSKITKERTPVSFYAKLLRGQESLNHSAKKIEMEGGTDGMASRPR